MEEQATSPAAVRAMEQMGELETGYGINDHRSQKIVAGEAATEYFELQLSQESNAFKHIELAASKTYVRGVIIVMIYFDGSIYATLADGEGDQPLLDVAFPDMSKKGGGFQIGTYDHPHFFKLSIWQGILRSPKYDACSPKSMASEDGESASRLARGGQNVALENSKKYDTAISSGGQTYLVFKHGKILSPVNRRENVCVKEPTESTKREAFFRFGNWCYSGKIDFFVDPGQMTLQKVQSVLPTIAAQQKGMCFSTEINSLPVSSKAYQVLLRLELVATFAVEQLINATEEIERLKKMLVNKGQRPWIDSDRRIVYFELQLTDDGAAPMHEVETACSKVFIKGILLSMIYVEKNIYIILDDGDGEHALLDSSFPDISSRARGFTLGCKPHEYFKKFSVWEGSHLHDQPATGFQVKSGKIGNVNATDICNTTDATESKLSHHVDRAREGHMMDEVKKKKIGYTQYITYVYPGNRTN